MYLSASLPSCPATKPTPPPLAVAADGTLYTGSYQTGALWQIDTDGKTHGIPGAAQRIGSVSGLDWADGALYILDRITPLDAQGAIIWRYMNGELETLARIPPGRANGVMLPDDIAIDSAGSVYISDRDPPRVLRLDRGRRRHDHLLAAWLRRRSAHRTGL